MADEFNSAYLSTQFDVALGKALIAYTPDNKPTAADIGAAAILTANRTIYVATTGNDTTGDGSSGSPYATLEKAASVIPKCTNGYDVTISLATGSYAGALFKGFMGKIYITLTGNVTLTTQLKVVSGTYIFINGSYTLTLNQTAADNVGIFVDAHSTVTIATSAVAINGAGLGDYGIPVWSDTGSAVVFDYPCSVSMSNIAYRAFISKNGASISFGYNVGITGTITGTCFVASAGMIYVNSYSATSGTKVMKEFGGGVKTGAGADLT